MSAVKLIPNMVFQITGVSSKFHHFYETFISLVKRIYVLFWHNLSLDPRVRVSPYHPPPENEVKMKTTTMWYYRLARLWFLSLHIYLVFTIILGMQGHIKLPTIILGTISLILTSLGTICGAHRYWAHRSYSATPALELFLFFCHCLSANYTLYYWTKLHRVHHKYSDTAADPHNANAGFFFSHLGWHMIQRTPECQKALEEIWCDDLKKNKLIMFQHKYWLILQPLISFAMPIAIPWYFWNENLLLSAGITFARFTIWAHMIGTVNSLAHLIGMKPFDKNMKPADHWLTWLVSFGDEGWHNYHHAFPSDYKSSEFWGYKRGLSTSFIELCAKLGLAYNLKTTSIEVAMKRRQRTGDLNVHVDNNWDYITTYAKKEKL